MRAGGWPWQLRMRQPRLPLALPAALLAACACAAALPSPWASQSEDAFVGWHGEVARAPAPTWVEPISWAPRAFVLHHLITDAEAQHIVELAWPRMQISSVVDLDGSSVLDDERTSYGAFINSVTDNVVRAIRERVALHTHAPVAHQEDVQVLRYGSGQYYHGHFDGETRMATILVYLSDPEEGGETSFTGSTAWASAEAQSKFSKGFSQCAEGHVAFKPRRGDALLFWSFKPDGKTTDMAATHESCPVAKGTKWTATIWVHTKPFQHEVYKERLLDSFIFKPGVPWREPGECSDKRGAAWCKAVAAAGGCTGDDAQHVKGTGLEEGACRRTCGACEVCAAEDRACFLRNRQRLGFLTADPGEIMYRRGDGPAVSGPLAPSSPS